MKMNKLQEKFEKWKVEREVDEHNESYEFRQGYVKAMCHAINEVKNLDMHIVTNPVKIMDWKYTETEKPLAYISGDWDGLNSDNVVAEDKSGKQYLAHYCEGFMDGSEFSDWYENSDFLINEEIVRWLSIPS